MLTIVSGPLRRLQAKILGALDLPGRTDAIDDPDPRLLGRLGAVLDSIDVEILIGMSGYDDALKALAKKMLRANTSEVNTLTGLSISELADPSIVRAWRKANADLIVSLCQDQIDDLRKTIIEPNTALRVEELAKLIQDRFGVKDSRAELIARDQTLKLNGQLTEANMRTAGVSRYIWTTSKDERVRGNPDGKYPDADPSHYAQDGQIYSWDDPPETGHPGQDFQCRCTPYPLIEGIDPNIPE